MTTRSRNTILSLAVLVVVTGACASDQSYATVDGREISRDAALAYSDVDTEATVAGGDQVRAGLTEMIYDLAAVSAAQSDFGVAITAEDIDERIANLPGHWVPVVGSLGPETGLPDAVLRSTALRTLLADTVGVELILQAHGSWEALLENAPELAARVCIRHLVVPTVEEAEEALDRIEAGEDFVAVATEVSLDSLNPGEIIDAANCPSHLVGAPPDLIALATTLPVGDSGGPVQSDAGYHVIKVEQRVVPTAAELEANPLDYLQLDSAVTMFSEWFTTVAGEADVDVESEVGRWSPDQRLVVPPSG